MQLNVLTYLEKSVLSENVGHNNRGSMLGYLHPNDNN